MTRREELENRRTEHVGFVAKAIRLAMGAHMGQKYGTYPYTKHLADVAVVLSRFGFHRKQLHAAAWLHDALEDTAIGHRDILSLSHMVYGIVSAVTNEPGVNRREHHLETYPKIQKNKYAITVKLADRIANVEESIKTDSKLLRMYQKEHGEFRAALFPFSTYEHKEMWRWLDEHLEGK